MCPASAGLRKEERRSLPVSGLVHPQGCEPRRRREERGKPAPDGCVLVAITDKPIQANSGWTCLLHGDGYPIPRYHKTWALIVSPQSRWWDRPDSNRHHVGLCGPDALPFKLLSHMGRPAPRMGAAIQLSRAWKLQRTARSGMPRSRQRGSDASSVRFCIQLLLQIVDVGQRIRVNRV